MNNYSAVKILILIVALVIPAMLLAQLQWKTHTGINKIQEVEFYKDKVYVSNWGGLLIIDPVTGEEEFLTKDNSSLNCSGTTEMVLTDDGNMWLSTYFSGLLYHNGDEFIRHYNVDSGDTLALVRDMVAGNGELWFWNRTATSNASEEAYLMSYRDGEFESHKGSMLNEIDAFAFDNESNFRVILDGSIFHYQNGIMLDELAITSLEGVDEYYISNFLFDSMNRIWISVVDIFTNQDYILKYEEEMWTSQMVNDGVKELIERENGDMLYTTSGESYGIISSSGAEEQITIEAFPEIPDVWERMEIKAIDENGAYWINTDSNEDSYQVFQVGDETTKGYGLNESYALNFTRTMTSDCEGNIYAISSSQLQKYDGTQWTTIYQDNLGQCAFTGLAYNPYDCSIWGFKYCGNSNELFKIVDDNLEEIPFDYRCQHIVFDDEGTMYASVRQDGFLVKELNGEVQVFDSTNSSLIWSLYCNRASKGVWLIGLGGPHGNLYYYDSGTLTNIQIGNLELSSEFSTWCYEDSKKQLWIMDEQGLVKYDRLSGDWTVYNLDFLDYSTSVKDLVEDQAGNYWITTDYNGLLKWDGNGDIEDNSTTYNIVNSGLLQNYCNKLEPTVDGDLWIRHNYGFTQLSGLLTSIEMEQASTVPAVIIYPNPTQGSLTIKVEDRSSVKYSVISTDGRQVMNGILENEELQLDLVPGLYLLEMQSGSQQWTEKLIITE